MARTQPSRPTSAPRRTAEEAALGHEERRAPVEKANASKLDYRKRNREECNLRSADAMRRRRAKVKTLPAKEQQAHRQQRHQHDDTYRSSHADQCRAASERSRHASNPHRITRTGRLQHPERYSASDKRIVQQNNAAKKWRRDRVANGEMNDEHQTGEDYPDSSHSDAGDGDDEHADEDFDKVQGGLF